MAECSICGMFLVPTLPKEQLATWERKQCHKSCLENRQKEMSRLNTGDPY